MELNFFSDLTWYNLAFIVCTLSVPCLFLILLGDGPNKFSGFVLYLSLSVGFYIEILAFSGVLYSDSVLGVWLVVGVILAIGCFFGAPFLSTFRFLEAFGASLFYAGSVGCIGALIGLVLVILLAGFVCPFAWIALTMNILLAIFPVLLRPWGGSLQILSMQLLFLLSGGAISLGLTVFPELNVNNYLVGYIYRNVVSPCAHLPKPIDRLGDEEAVRDGRSHYMIVGGPNGSVCVNSFAIFGRNSNLQHLVGDSLANKMPETLFTISQRGERRWKVSNIGADTSFTIEVNGVLLAGSRPLVGDNSIVVKKAGHILFELRAVATSNIPTT